MIKERIQKAIKVIDYAIANNLTVRVASVQCGYSNSYVKNVKWKVIEKYTAGALGLKEYKVFMDKYDEYDLKKEENQSKELVEYRPVSVSGGACGKAGTSGFSGSVGTSCTGLSGKSEYVCCDSFAPNGKSFVDPVKKITEVIKQEQLLTETKGNITNIDWKAGDNYPADHIKTPEELLKAAKVDSEMWAIKDYSVNKWDVTSFKQDLPQTVQNYQVKIRLEKNVELFEAVNLQKLIGDVISKYVPPQIAPDLRVWPDGVNTTEKNLLEISIFDLHIGKLCWAGETGENYDSKIARTRFMSALTTIIKRASSFNYERILFPIGNDFFNSDNKNNTTTHGTPQDEDLRWQKTFGLGINLLADAINLMKTQNVPIDVIVIPGNHDFERSFYLGEVLKGWFNHDPMVNIDNGASPRKYYRYHDVLLGFTHGSEEKESTLPMLMAIDTESKPMWSETRFHEWHLGHIHRKKSYRYGVDFNRDTLINEEMGVTIRYLSSLTGTEEWHHKNTNLNIKEI